MKNKTKQTKQNSVAGGNWDDFSADTLAARTTLTALSLKQYMTFKPKLTNYYFKQEKLLGLHNLLRITMKQETSVLLASALDTDEGLIIEIEKCKSFVVVNPAIKFVQEELMVMGKTPPYRRNRTAIHWNNICSS